MQILGVIGLSVTLAHAAATSTATSEAELLLQLETAASLEAKSGACQELKRIGTEKSVECLGRLLADINLSEAAREALESIPGQAASEALIDGLTRTTGSAKAGLIDSLMQRKDLSAIKPLAGCLADSDPIVAQAAARALGRLGDKEAVGKVQKAFTRDSRSNLRAASLEAVLTAAESAWLRSNDRLALSWAHWAYSKADETQLAEASFLALLRYSRPGDACTLATKALSTPESPEASAALTWAKAPGCKDTTMQLCKLLPAMEPTARPALLDVLGERGDTNAAAYVLRCLASAERATRLSALRALGELGDDSSIVPLAQHARSTEGDEQRTAREALVSIRHGKPSTTLIANLRKVEPGVCMELVRAAGERHDASVLKDLAEFAKEASPEVRRPVLEAAAKLATPADLPVLGGILLHSDANSLEQCAEVFMLAYQSLLARYPKLSSDPLITTYEQASTPTRISLLPILALLRDAQSADTLRKAASGPDQSIKATAVRAMAGSANFELVPNLLNYASVEADPTLRDLCFSACARLVSDETSPGATAQKLATCKSLLGLARRPEQKKQVLSALAALQCVEATDSTLSLLADDAVKQEAIGATLQIALSSTSKAQIALSAAEKASDAARGGPFQSAAEAVIATLKEHLQYVTAWEFSGPYVSPGKDYAALFNIPFAPENAGNAAWIDCAPRIDVKRPGVIDLLQIAPGTSQAGYLRTVLHSDKDQEGFGELGSDDGVKIWLNGKEVYANNVARALLPGSDRFPIHLVAGRNDLLLKLTQNVMGWEFCLRLVAQDGKLLTNVRSLQPASAGIQDPASASIR